MNCTFDLSFYAKSFVARVPQARNRKEEPGWPATPGQQVQHLGLLSQGHTPYAFPEPPESSPAFHGRQVGVDWVQSFSGEFCQAQGS